MTTHLDQVTQSLRERILSGAYASNDKLAETALAEALGGSRTLIRLALGTLELENLVGRFQSSNHMQPSKQPHFSVQSSMPQLSGFMESVV